jgi:integrase
MAGQIIKRGDKTWLVRIFLGRDELGSRRYLNKTIKGAKKDAQKYLNATLTAISTGNFVQESAVSLNKFLDDWLESAAKPRVSERTFAEYTALLTRYVREPLGKTMLSDLRALQIQASIRKCKSVALVLELSDTRMRFCHLRLNRQ